MIFMPRQINPNVNMIQNGIGPHYYLGKQKISHLETHTKYQYFD